MILIGCVISTLTIAPMGADDNGVTDLREVLDDDGNVLYRTSDSASASCMLVPTFYSLYTSFLALFGVSVAETAD